MRGAQRGGTKAEEVGTGGSIPLHALASFQGKECPG